MNNLTPSDITPGLVVAVAYQSFGYTTRRICVIADQTPIKWGSFYRQDSATLFPLVRGEREADFPHWGLVWDADVSRWYLETSYRQALISVTKAQKSP